MKYKEMYDDSENIDVESYLKKSGVEDVDDYFHGGFSHLESPQKYKNMNKAVEEFIQWIV
jgi:hypothetical protein